MLTLHKKNNLYQVEENGQPLGWIELFRNPYHAANCYLKIELNRLEPSFGTPALAPTARSRRSSAPGDGKCQRHSDDPFSFRQWLCL